MLWGADRIGHWQGNVLMVPAGIGSTSPLEAFCVRLKRLQEASGLTQAALAGHANLRKSQMSAVLNGHIRRPPEWGVVLAVVEACLGHAKQAGRAVPGDICDIKDWRRRYGDLEVDLQAVAPQRSRHSSKPERLVREWDPFTLGVHHPIAVQDSVSEGLAQLPWYVLREHDRQLRDWLDPTGQTPQMLVLTGQSCVGKTRAAYEANTSDFRRLCSAGVL